MATDRNGTEISVGDTIETVYAGDHHNMVVEALGESHGIPTVTGTITITQHAPACYLVKKAAKKPAAKKQTTATELEETNG